MVEEELDLFLNFCEELFCFFLDDETTAMAVSQTTDLWKEEEPALRR